MFTRRIPRRAAQLTATTLMLFAASAVEARDAQPPALTVATYNIHHGVGVDGVLDLERIADVLHQTGAEVIGLQEVDNHWSSRSDFADQALELAALLGMDYAYGANLDLDPPSPGAERRQYGTAILSAYPIVASSNALLPNLGGEQRGLLEAKILVHGVPVRVLNTHLQHNSAEERFAQTAAIAARLDAIDEPVVLLGDLNAEPAAAEMGAIAARLDDAWPLAGEGPGFTIPVEAPDRRIDYVFLGRCLDARQARVGSSLASDHLPVSAALALPSLARWKLAGSCRPQALANAHAHNDYEHERPLQDALAHGFSSVEADVWLVDGQLLVAHDREDVDPERTFEALYLEPLRARIRAQHGRAHGGWPHSLQLLIDIKSEAEPTYLAVHEALAKYDEIFTTFVDGHAFESAVTAVISGNRPRELMVSQRVRYAGYDGRMSDLGSEATADFIPLISDRWTNVFSWQGAGAMPEAERERLREIVSTAHAKGQRVRFWATPDVAGEREPVWRELASAGVDYINTDDLSGLRSWLLRHDAAPSRPEVDWFDRFDGVFEWLPWLRAR